MDAYRIAIDSRVDCIEIDVSRSLDGELFALHDRYLVIYFISFYFTFEICFGTCRPNSGNDRQGSAADVQ